PDGLIEGAVDPALVLTGVTLEDEGDYFVEVSNECGTITSESATLTVNPWTQVIDFNGQVNGMSTYLELIENDIATIFNPIMDTLLSIEFMQPSKVYVPGAVSFDWNEAKGAKTAIKAGLWPTSITVTGYPTLGTEVSLPAGWSLIPVWSQGVVLTADVFGPLGGNLIAAFSIDYSGIYWPAYNIYSLEYLVPGSAYLVALAAPGTIDFNVPLVKSATPGYVSLPINTTTWKSVQMSGLQHNIAITAEALAQLKVGDIIGAFNQNGAIAGMVEINSITENTAIRLYGDDSGVVNGINEGDVLTFKLYRNGETIDLTATFDPEMPNANIFARNGLSSVVTLKAGVTSINDYANELTVNLYPNPAKEFVNIETNFEISNLKVVNYVGQVVFDQNLEQSNYLINTSSFGPGMYFVQIQTINGVVITKRLTVN
ncbi:MAG TPA: T9SS type A sorting domain-containing protein, partial [Bacteroidales bacterium]|nr:T9SS type A sorting domain-containing protein [Bacteroidales bacterium]